MTRDEIRMAEERARAEMDLILGENDATYEFFREHLRRFVMAKYSLDSSDCEETDNLERLSEISLSKALKVSRDLIADYEAGQNCEGATSATVKRSLLIVKIQRELSIKFSLQDLMEITTLDDVIRLAWLRYRGESV